MSNSLDIETRLGKLWSLRASEGILEWRTNEMSSDTFRIGLLTYGH